MQACFPGLVQVCSYGRWNAAMPFLYHRISCCQFNTSDNNYSIVTLWIWRPVLVQCTVCSENLCLNGHVSFSHTRPISGPHVMTTGVLAGGPFCTRNYLCSSGDIAREAFAICSCIVWQADSYPLLLSNRCLLWSWLKPCHLWCDIRTSWVCWTTRLWVSLLGCLRSLDNRPWLVLFELHVLLKFSVLSSKMAESASGMATEYGGVRGLRWLLVTHMG